VYAHARERRSSTTHKVRGTVHIQDEGNKAS